MFGQFLGRKGFRVTEAKNALEALRVLKLQPIDLILTDYHMPEMNGIDLLREVRKRNPRLPVVIMSGAADMRTAIGLQQEAFDFLSKPVDADDLLVTINLAFKHNNPPEAPESAFDSGRGIGPVYIRVDPARPGVTICEFNRPLDEHSQKAFDTALRRLRMEGGVQASVVFVLKNVSYINNVGLNFLLSVYEDWRKGHRIIFCQVSEPVHRYFKILGYLDYFPNVPTLQEAFEAIS